MPIQVYLDSSDYSILSDPKSEDKRIEQTKDQLLSFLDRGVIEIRFSCIHVLEMAHASLKYRDLALKRFKVLDELCRNKVLLYVSEMENIEIATVAKGQINSLEVQTIANDEGKWCPDMISQFGDLKKFIINELSNQLKKTGLSRDQRKYFEKKLFKGGRLTDKGFDYLSKDRKCLNDALSLKFPLTEKFWKEDLFLQYLRGTVKEPEILQEIQKGFIDPVNFIGWYINRDAKGLELPNNFRNIGECSTYKIRSLKEKCQKAHDIGKQLQKTEKEIKQKQKSFKDKINNDSEKFRKKYLEKIWDKRQRDLLKIGVTKKLWNSKIKTSTLGQTPSIDFYIQSMITYSMNSVGNLQNSRKLLSSDHGDLMHGRYLPYVEIFRADRYMGNLYSHLARQYRTKVVTSFIKLPEYIEEMWSKSFQT